MANLQRKRIYNIVQYLFFLGFGIVLLYLSFRKVDMGEVWSDILTANYYWLFLSLVVALISHFFRALRWNLLINSMGYKTNVTSTFFAVMVGYMANTAVPRMGEFMRCGILSKKEKIPFNALFGTVISERLFDLVILLSIIVLVIFFQFDLLQGLLAKLFGNVTDSGSLNISTILLVTISMVVFFSGLIFFIRQNHIFFSRFSIYQKLITFLEGLVEGIQTIVKLKEKGLFIFYTFIIWLAYAGMVYLPLFMFPETSQLDFIDALTIMSIGSLGIVAPVPGGIGAYHFIVKAILFELYKINGATAGSFAAITHAGQTIINILVGAIGYFYLTMMAKTQKPLNEKSGIYTK